MRLSCSCGVLIGFLLAMALSGMAYYYFFLRDNPEISARGMQKIEENWERTKRSGDHVIDTIRPYASPQTGKQETTETP